jgi:hypothetical protein
MADSTIDTTTATIWMEDNIVRIKIKDGARVELKDAMEHVDAVWELCGDQKHVMLTDISRVASTSREARAAYRAEPSALSALAILTNSPISRVIAGFFVRVSQPGFPTKVFSNEASALSWLHDQRTRS